METITFDSSLSDQLSSINHPVQVCDPQGRLLGYYRPAGLPGYLPPESSPEEYAAAKDRHHAEEIELLKQMPSVGSTAEVLQRLGIE